MFAPIDEDPKEFELSTSHQRFQKRLEKFGPGAIAKANHHLWWVVHNCVAHSAIGIAPIKPFFAFHDWTSRRLNRLD